MGLFGKKKDNIVDLSERYKMQIAATPKQKTSSSNIEFLRDMASGSSNSSNKYNSPEGGEEKKNKLAKRLLDMTNRMEDLSNQIYHLKQRIELLEKKMKVSFELK